VGELLREHQANLAGFLTDDPKGKVVPGFIIQLGERLEAERATLRREHDHLVSSVEHIKEIVAMQQSYARVSGFLEQVSIARLLDDALQINLAGLERHGVRIVRKYSEVPPLMVDKHKVLQILVNLMHNAKYALDGSRSPDKWLEIGVSLTSGRRVRITVTDNGIGIPPENLTRVFSHGFTTRKGGHGFGLHSGANAAKEMGGQLTAYSEGLDQGATFTLDLPLDYQRST
jgi:C4-dicarboxylate-specific signal transduction histidine kinase